MDITNTPTIVNPASALNDLELTALVPIEMINAQQQLITWTDGKLFILSLQSKELHEAFEHAKKMKWKSSALQNAYRQSLKRISFYEKLKAALLEGYYIVPNFPIQMFAIKTTSKDPIPGHTYSWSDSHEQSSKELRIGEGEYKNPFPLQKQRSVTNGDIVRTEYWAGNWDDFEFPMMMAKPTIMKATSRAMALKIFDQIGIMPAAKKEDPVIIGQIKLKSGYNTKLVSFMIAWHLNTNVL